MLSELFWIKTPQGGFGLVCYVESSIDSNSALVLGNGPLARYVKLWVAHWLQRKPLVSDPGMHHSMWVTHMPWCMSGSLTSGGGENVLGIPGACATHNFTYLARGPWIGASLTSAHCKNQCWITVNWNPWCHLQWHLNKIRKALMYKSIFMYKKPRSQCGKI